MENNQSTKKLYRSAKGQMVGGVCAGFAEYFNIEVTLVRILWVILTIMGGAGVLAYLICLIIIPKNPETDEVRVSPTNSGGEKWGLYIGVGLAALGLWIFLDRNFLWFPFNIPWHIWHMPRQMIWPGVLIALGLLLVLRGINSPASQDTAKSAFTRSRNQRMLAGVCGGLAKYFQIDVTLVRIGYVLLTLLTVFWLGVIAYIVMAAAVPEEPPNQQL